MRVVGIDFNPAPDAEERLRRLFTMLLKLADDELPSPDKDPSPDGGGGGGTVASETACPGIRHPASGIRQRRPMTTGRVLTMTAGTGTVHPLPLSPRR